MNFYVYVIRFVDGYYYYGYHPTYGNDPRLDNYFGTPVTHREKWLTIMYSKEVLGLYETFEEADAAEQALIRPCYKSDPFCLNENCGGAVSPELCRVGGQRGGNTNKKSGQAYEWGKKYGRIAVESGQLAAAREKIDKEKQRKKAKESGKINGRKAVESGQFREAQEKSWESVRKRHEEKDEDGKSVLAKEMWEGARQRQIGIFDPSRQDEYKEKYSQGGKKVAAQRWIDPQHPDLGERSAAILTWMQKCRGYPHGKENRIRVG